MSNLDENYFLRKCYFKREQVPTQSVMKKKMQALAGVYFKSMTPKLKVLAGLEPPLKGGGTDWYVPPAELLKERMVMKPCKKEHLSKLGYKGIDEYTEKFVADHNRNMELEKAEALLKNDHQWMRDIEMACEEQWDEKSREQAKLNTAKLLEAFSEFEAMYRNSIVKIEGILLDATENEVEKVRQAAYEKMNEKYKNALEQQATSIYERLTARLEHDVENKKKNFIEKVEKARNAAAKVAHDINVDKHVATEKLRHLLACQRLACQIYVALKEKEAQEKEIEEMKHEHQKKLTVLRDKICWQNYEIALLKEKEKARQYFIKIWKKKVCRVVKTFQEFVSYCLRTMPEQAEFFINMERLLMLQMSEAVENPEEESIFEPETEEYTGPVPRTRPFIVYGDYGVKPQYDDNLCPSRRGSNLSHLPVVVVNKRCVYTVCDSLKLFTDKMERYAKDRLERDIQDDHDYKCDIPVTYSASQQLAELNLQGSLMRLLQDDIVNTKNVQVECSLCKLPFCFCHPKPPTKSVNESPNPTPEDPPCPDKTILPRDEELRHEREPNWESYMDFIKPTRCKCPKTAKKHLREHLPPYMRNTSKFASLELPNYEPCSLETMKMLVEEARHRPPPKVVEEVELNTREIATQYSDEEFDAVCDCFSESELQKLCTEILKADKQPQEEKLLGKYIMVQSTTPPYMKDSLETFTMDRVHSLRKIIGTQPQLEEIFSKNECASRKKECKHKTKDDL